MRPEMPVKQELSRLNSYPGSLHWNKYLGWNLKFYSRMEASHKDAALTPEYNKCVALALHIS